MQEVFKVPNHVGFIMDGNGRWATKQNKPRNYGHQKGAENVKNIVSLCFERGVKVVSLYAFSCENFGRPKEEVDKILNLLQNFLNKYIKTLIKNEIRLVVSGDISVFNDNLKKSIINCEEKTSKFTNRTLNIAINYSGKQEIVFAVNNLIKKGCEITEASIQQELQIRDIPNIDLVIRTSGEQRLSNFFIWQTAYSELYFTEAFWPEFDEVELNKALIWYSKRERRFGKL